MAVKTLLVCGDSFFYDQKVNYPGLHWTQKMPESVEVTNMAYPGASNAMILDQFTSNYDDHDAVVFGFTSPWRLEFGNSPDIDYDGYHAKYMTSNYYNRLSEKHQTLSNQYKLMTSDYMEFVKCASVIITAINLARERCRVAYSLSGGRFMLKHMSKNAPDSKLLVQILDQDLPLNLLDYFESSEYSYFREKSIRDPLSHPCFHVHHDHVQAEFAKDVMDCLEIN